MSKEEFQLKFEMYKAMARVIFHMMIKPTLYMIVMWMFEVAAAFIFFKDIWNAAGFVSAITLYQITSAEFHKEFFGTRQDAIQK